MPVLKMYCSECDIEENRVSPRPPAQTILCKKCQNPMTRIVLGPSLQIKETIDNGIMPKKVEVLKDIEKMMEERSKKHDPRNQ